jgi:hypothetical protein
MLKISVNPGSEVKMGNNVFKVHTIFTDCLYIDTGESIERVGYSPVTIYGNSTIQFIRKKLRNPRALIGLTSPHRIQRIPQHKQTR